MLAMTEEPDNLTLQHLRQIRTEMQEGFALASRKNGAIAESIVSMRKRLDGIDHRLDHMSQSIDGLRTDIQTVALAVDEHTTRLNRIDEIHLSRPDA